MKKTLTFFLIYFVTTITNSYAAKNCCIQDCGLNSSYDSSCTNEEICNCELEITTNNTSHVITTVTGTRKLGCNGTIRYAECLRSIPRYTCENGYYGTPLNSTSGCNKCPEPGTSKTPATDLSQCYIPAERTNSDSTGTYIYTNNCYYSI